MSKIALCYWCSCRVFRYSYLKNKGLIRYGKPVPDNMHTSDHLYHRGDPRRKHSCETVVSCLRCNNDRAIDYLHGRPEWKPIPSASNGIH